MVRLLKDETLVSTWKNFFEEQYKGDIETLALSYPQKRSLYVDYDIIDKYDTTVSEGLLKEPYKYIYNGEQALKEIDTVAGYIQLHLRITNLPDICKKSIRDLRSEHMGKLVSIEGLIKKDTTIKAEVILAAFQCNKCGAIIRVGQTEDIIREPTECYEDQGGCGRVSNFKLTSNLSTFIDGQKIQLQENPEGLRGGEQPQKITVQLKDDLVGQIYPGDRVRINGILQGMQRRRGAVQLKTFDFRMETLSIEINESLYEEIEITEKDEIEIKKTAKDPEIYDKMQSSIAPTIYGLENEKLALVLQLFGGVKKTTNDGTRIRGDIHIIFVGDPSTAKSQLLMYMYQLAPRSILASGSGSTKAGLTATAVKDEFSEGQWILDAGALVLADGGIACIDEFDKMSDEDRGSMHQAMEQQEVSIAKAGINVTLKTGCSILAVANPKLGRFDGFIPIHEQINLKPALLSRFDLIFPIRDKPGRKRDMEISQHILETHKNPDGEKLAPCYSPEFIRKYVAYAKQNIKPKLTDKAMDIIQNFYVDFRNTSENTVSLTPRHLEAFIRLSEASAKVRLSDKVTVGDAKRAIKIVDTYLMSTCIDPETGHIDIDKIAIGLSHSQQDRMKTIIDAISNLCSNSTDGASIEDIIRECETVGIAKEKTEESLKRLKVDNQIFECRTRRYKIYV